MAGLGVAESMKTAFVALLSVLLYLAGPRPVQAAAVWLDQPDTAFAEAKRSGKVVLVDLYADWCGWCKVMERDVFSTPEFQSYAERFVLLRVDVEDGGAGSEIQRRFQANSLPTLLLLDANRALVGEVEGFLPTARLLARLDGALRTHRAAIAAFDRALAGNDPAAWQAQARAAHQRGDGERAAQLFEKLITQGGLAGDDLAWARLQLADSYRFAGRFTDADRALGELVANLAAAANPKIRERADLLKLYLARERRDCAAAAGALAEFEKGHPNSPLLADARRTYRALQSDSTAQCS